MAWEMVRKLIENARAAFGVGLARRAGESSTPLMMWVPGRRHKTVVPRPARAIRAFFPLLLLCAVASCLSAPVAGAQVVSSEAPPFIATPDAIVETMLEMAGVEDGDLVYDLGSGDGRLVIAAALRGARGVGIEYDRSLVERSWLGADSAGVRPLVEFVHGDIFETDVSGADVVMLYLSPEFNLRLRPRLLRQLSPGARIVSHAFHMGDWTADETRTLGEGAARATLFLWTVPAHVDGFWSLEARAEEPITLELRQEFQRLTGSAWRGDEAVQVTGSVHGHTVRFSLHRGSPANRTDDVLATFSGRLVGSRIVGHLRRLDGSVDAVGYRFTDPVRAPR